jgi:cytochrome b pre-mRNA-processing protein 3
VKRRKQEVLAGSLYQAIVAQARDPGFYRDLAVPDTIEGRFEMIVLHCTLVMRRLRAGEKAVAALGQPLLEYMFGDFDRSIREIGVGDMSVGKYMKRLGKSFYGRATAYDQALDAGDTSLLAEAIGRNILATSEEPEDRILVAAGDIAHYIMACERSLVAQKDDDMAKACISFPALQQEYV